MNEICEILTQHAYFVTQAVEVPTTKEVAGADTYYRVAAANNDGVALDLAVGADKSLIVVQNLDSPAELLTETLKDLDRMSEALASDTVLVQVDQGDFAAWQEYGYTKKYQCILTGEQNPFELERVDRVLAEMAAEIAAHLEEEIQIFELASDLPYIYSVDLVEASASSPLEADYHCCLHCHELTGAVYLEQLWIPEEKRRQGIGTATVNILKESLAEAGANYLYLKATESSESFWDAREDFASFYRLNQRWARRMREQLRREPGWDRVLVNGVQLEYPLEYYGNHPGEDWDFFQAQQLLWYLND